MTQPLPIGQAVWAVLNAAPDVPFRELVDLVQRLNAAGVALVAMPSRYVPDDQVPAVDLTQATPTKKGPAPFLRDTEGDYWAHIGGGRYRMLNRLREAHNEERLIQACGPVTAYTELP